MTTAYDFPDLNISPILGEEESDHETVEENLANLQGSHHVDAPIQDILKGLSISGSDPSRNVFSSGASEVESCTDAQRRPTCLHGNSQPGESFDSSSEEAFAALECEMKRSLFSVAESCDIATDLQESFCSILSGCRISVEMGCCTESSEDVRSRLRRMGAIVSRRFSETTTHVVFSLGGRAAILRRAFSLPKKPFLVDPHWVYECFNTRTRVPEEQYSLYDCRFLLDALRRSLDTRCPSENTELSHRDNTGAYFTTSTSHVNEERLIARSILTEDEEVTFNRSMSASELLVKINLLSKRLDRIGAASCVLGNRCPSAQKSTLADGICQRRAATDSEQHPYITMRRKVLRRRTHGAFPLEYRDPFCVAVQVNAESRDEQDAVYGRRRQTDFPENNDDENNKGISRYFGTFSSSH
ncbi:hypothetical protein GCK32_003850 [Trichostrongylus colubriformis]|uniref:BRCT domain-containing protein n=1 Tax=Trichostrongylus colubriformis TaxID=6319 RepID=A0AAN8FMR7_TRICO